MSWSYTHVWQLKIGRNVGAAEVPAEEQRVLVPHQAAQPRVAVPGGKVPITSGCGNKQGFWLCEYEGFWSLRVFIKGHAQADKMRLRQEEAKSSLPPNQ